MQLLIKKKNDGYPEAYLVARIRARLDYSFFSETSSEKEVILKLYKEMNWLYYQMNPYLVNTFSSVFLFFEIKSVLTAIRFKMSGLNNSKEILSLTVLANEFQDCFEKYSDVRLVLNCICNKLIHIFDDDSVYKEIINSYDLKKFEEMLYTNFLRYALKNADCMAIKEFFQYQIDKRNIMSIYKNLRWKLDVLPEFIDGGKIKKETLINTFREGLNKVLQLIKDYTNIEELTDLEDAFSSSFTVHLKKYAIWRTDIDLILYYIWKLNSEALHRTKFLKNIIKKI